MKARKFNDQQLSLFDLFDSELAVAEPPADVSEKVILTEAIEVALAPVKEPRKFFELTEKMLDGLGSDSSKVEANMAAIEVLATIRQERRAATDDEKRAMARYTGWGGLSEVFANAGRFQAEQDRLKELLGPSEYRMAEESVLTAYYTEIHVAKAMWEMVRALGFTGGSVVEPSCGAGHFIGAMPNDLRQKSKVTMVDVDPTTADIAAALYEDEETRCYNMGIEKTRFVSACDAVVGNVPFGQYRVRDERLDRLKLNIHDYFIAKALDMVRPGGLVALITSSNTMDGVSKEPFREHIHRLAEVKKVVRLPAGAFARLGGTDVVADIIVLQRRYEPLSEEDRRSNPIARCKEIPYKLIAADTKNQFAVSRRQVNGYFTENPGNVLGRFDLGSTRWGDSVTVKAQPGWEAVLAESAKGLEDCFDESLNVSNTKVGRKQDPNGVKNYVSHGYFFDEEGQLMLINERNEVEPLTQLPAATVQRLVGMTRIRDCALSLLEADSRQEASAENIRKTLTGLYDAFVAKHGPLMGQTNQRLFRDDTHAPLLWSLERWDDENEVATKAEIFTRSTVSHATLADEASTIDDAIALSYNKLGRLDVETVARYLKWSEQQVLDALQESSRIYLDPETVKWVDSLDYLSGKVREKHRAAVAAAKRDPAFDRNVAALAEVLPPLIPIRQVSVRLGVPWIGADMVEKWLIDTFGIGKEGTSQCYGRLSLTRAKETASWSVSYTLSKQSLFDTEWGTKRKGFWSLLENLLHQKTPEVFDEVETAKGGKSVVINRDETIAAQEKAEKIQASFAAWLVADEQRANEAETIYNDAYNGVVNRAYDGSHLVVPGLNPAIELRQAQKDSVWRGIVSGNVLYALAVGGGKTLIQIVLAQESKRLGLANKPVLVVPGHMLTAFAGEYLRAFPKAKVLAASKDDLVGPKRRALLMRMAVNDWDAIIMTHSTFGKISVGKDHIEEMINEVKLQARTSVMGVSDRNLVREASRAGLQAESVLKGLIKGDQDEGIPGFEKLGIDMALIDEADLYKALFFFTRKKRIPGISSNVSQRAMDLFIKSRIIFNARGDNTRGLVFSTATPISNTVGEAFIMQTYLQQERLRELGIDNFDAWCANFAREVTCVEVKPEGSGYRLQTRFSAYTNVPELMLIFREVAEIRTKRQLKLPEPELHGGAHEIIVVPPSDAQKEFVQGLAKRAEDIRSGLVKPDQDNMLCVTGDGRKAAIDMRCVDPLAAIDKGNKVHACIDRVYEFWLSGQDQKTTQLVFSDLSVPGGVFSVYEYMRDALVKRGVPVGEIAFAQSYGTDKLKSKLHRMVRAGLIRVLIGSTELMGFGTNVQDRLIAEHHLDAPWRPRDVEQRDGRIIRQGNMHDVVHILRYVTSGSFDSYLWSILERKARFIAQVMENDGVTRNIEDVSTQALSFAEVKALASGNPIVIEKAAVDAQVAKLFAIKSVFMQDKESTRRKLQWRKEDVSRTAAKLEAHGAFMRELQMEAGTATIQGKELNAADASKAIMSRAATVKASYKQYAKTRKVDKYSQEVFTVGNLVLYLYAHDWRYDLEFRAALKAPKAENGFKVSIPHGAARIEELLNSNQLVDELLAIGTSLQASLGASREELADLEIAAAQKFEFEDALQSALARKVEIDSELEIDTGDTSALALEMTE